MQNIEFWYNPVQTATECMPTVENEPEMSSHESAFLCGLIKQYKPRKILEVGIAAGATTGIIIEAAGQLDYGHIDMYSVDLSVSYYRDKNKSQRQSGFMADSIINKYASTISHNFFLGKYLPEVLDDIGYGIDFFVLDTVHAMPGEFLDYISVLPFLKEGAVVVLHDTEYHLYHQTNPSCGFSNNLLYGMMCGDKITQFDPSRPFLLPNITAMVITSDSKKYINNVFWGFSYKWEYIISTNEFEIYRNWYSKFYDKDSIQVFASSYAANCTLSRKPLFKKIVSGLYLFGKMVLRGL